MREKILDVAITIISEHGYKYFSMRKLASRLGMSATTIYNYYSSKDELYLMMLTKGFDMLYSRLLDIYGSHEDPLERFREMIRAYAAFGIEKAHYYNIMFTSDAPKYRDYIGTDIEPVAYFEKQTALRLVDIASRGMEELARVNPGIDALDSRYAAIKLWSFLHGIIALCNSRVLQEVDDHPDRIIDRIVEDIVRLFVPEALKAQNGENSDACRQIKTR